MLSLPTLLLAWHALTDDEVSTAPALWTGLVTGVLVLAAGVRTGAWAFDRRGAELMEFVETV